ncbi:unnamed protein product [Acanthoscelides obtectus]|uniref:Uncharacterized protein n=1 Tax=Acanthoscelides obtectus TaxID=200917 RepID=A0A9P0NYC7_ACAOB|nr:unnamed protein product [Acanthoscelides obtectus]CAK1666005.1 hypothetical protein AOBTE_LOCUS25107 [Acanthoscelides obtectus]
MISFKCNLHSKTAKENISVQADLANWGSYRAGLDEFKKSINATLTKLVDSEKSEGNSKMTQDADSEAESSDEEDGPSLKRPLSSPMDKASKQLKT